MRELRKKDALEILCGSLLGALPLRAAHAWRSVSGEAANRLSQKRYKPS
jgi:hypothetical protein